MFWGLASGTVDPRQFKFEHVLKDIQGLNEWALEGRLEVTAISLHAYPYVQQHYAILPHGASMAVATARSSWRASRSTPRRCATSRSPCRAG